MPFDAIVVGLGAFGSATLYQLARMGVRAVGIDRFDPPHALGSSHGETRITRLALGEGAAYAPLVQRSHQIWRTLEAETGLALLEQCGGLIMARPNGATHHGRKDFYEQTVAVAERHGIPHEILDAAGVAARFPQFGLVGDERAYFEPEAGYLSPEPCVQAQLDMARRLGAQIRTNERVLEIHEEDGGVVVRTDRDTLRAGRCIVTAGPWIGELLGPSIARVARPFRQTLHWFEAERPHDYAPGRFPIYIWIHGCEGEAYIYGFPTPPGSAGVKVATEQYADPTAPDAADRTVSAAETDALYRDHVAGRLRGVGPRAVRTATCFYTVTPDADFIVGHPPGMSRVLAVSACSGHGFKHSAGTGEAIAAMVTGDSGAAALLEPFALSRFGAV